MILPKRPAASEVVDNPMTFADDFSETIDELLKG